MADKIKLVRGDTRPQVKVVVKSEKTGQPVDISGSTVRMLFRAVGSQVLQATVPGVLLNGLELDGGEIDTTSPYDVNGAGGRCVFLWRAGDLDCEPGEYEAEVEVTFSDGGKQTVYDLLKFKLREEFGG